MGTRLEAGLYLRKSRRCEFIIRACQGPGFLFASSASPRSASIFSDSCQPGITDPRIDFPQHPYGHCDHIRLLEEDPGTLLQSLHWAVQPEPRIENDHAGDFAGIRSIAAQFRTRRSRHRNIQPADRVHSGRPARCFPSFGWRSRGLNPVLALPGPSPDEPLPTRTICRPCAGRPRKNAAEFHRRRGSGRNFARCRLNSPMAARA